MDSSTKKGILSWAQLRFSVIGGLLANPPEKGELKGELQRLAKKRYRHPLKDEWITFGVSTIERWYYQALKADDPIAALGRKVRTDAGRNKTISPRLLGELKNQYQTYPNWSYRLHADNLRALVLEYPELGDIPSYSTVLRRMQKLGWTKKRFGPRHSKPGQIRAAFKLDNREVRSFESTHVHGLWLMQSSGLCGVKSRNSNPIQQFDSLVLSIIIHRVRMQSMHQVHGNSPVEVPDNRSFRPHLILQ